jgi:Na+/proline symporter
VALFVLVIVGIVVAQTWLDWRDARKDWMLPEWAKGMALAGAVVAMLTAATSFTSFWLEGAAGSSSDGFGSGFFWPELGFLLCAMAVIIFAVRKKRLRVLLVLTVLLIAAFWLGMTLSS